MNPNQIQPGMQVPQDPSQGLVPPMQGMPVEGGQPVSEEQKQALLDMISQIRAQLGSLGAMRFASGNKTELLRRDLLKQVFEKLQLAGVDLSSRESVAAFIMKLQEESPELAAMFEKAMDALLGGVEGGAFGTPQDPNATIDLGISPQNNMNNNINPNETVPQDI
jgi:hypothetical protein